MCSRAQVSTANHALNHSSVIRSSAAAYLVNLYSSLHSHSDFSPSAAARRHCLSPFFFPIIVQHTPSLSVSSPDHLQHIKIPFFSLQRIAPLPREFLHSCFSLSLSFRLSLPPRSCCFFSCCFVFPSHLWPSPSCYLTAPTCRARAPAVPRFFGCRAGLTLPNRSVRGKPRAQVD